MSQQVQNLRVVTLNTWKCDGDYFGRIPLIIEQLAVLDADVIALQECFHTADGEHNTALTVAAALDMQCSLLSYRQKPRRIMNEVQDSYSGLAILSKTAAVSEQHLLLPTVEEDGDRDGLLCRYSIGESELAIVNLHLSHLRSANDLRLQQLKKVIELTQNIITESTENVVICGDFNSPLAPFVAENMLSPQGGLIDAWQQFHGSPQTQPTVHVQHRVPEKELESGVLDHVLLLPNGNVVPKVTAATRVLDQVDSASNLLPSDHVGICVDLLLEIKL